MNLLVNELRQIKANQEQQKKDAEQIQLDLAALIEFKKKETMSRIRAKFISLSIGRKLF